MGEFTKGPWVKDKHGDLRGSDGRQVEVYSTGLVSLLSGPTESAVANTHLIAAAPDLFEAMKALIADCDKYVRINNLYDSKGEPATWATIENARSALRKAQGDSQ